MKDADHALNQSLAYTQSLVAELTPPTLKEFGLLQALTWLATQRQCHGLAVTVRQDATPLPLPEDQAVLLFQSVRELLFNVLKHAKATEATIGLTVRDDGQLEVVVADDGCGFVTAPQNRPGTTANRFRLFSIQERMAAMGGQLVIESVLGVGTRATLTTPYWNSRETPTDDDTLAPAESRAPSLRTRSTDVEDLSLHPTSKIGILLVDNHAMVRQGLRRVLEHYDDVAVVGEASTGREAIEFVERLRPAVVVMDINMPETNGIDETVEIKSRHPDVAIIGLSVQNTGEAREAMLQAGAATLISKESAVDELYASIRQALADDGVPR